MGSALWVVCSWVGGLQAQPRRITRNLSAAMTVPKTGPSSTVDTLPLRIVINRYGEADKRLSRPGVIRLRNLEAPAEWELIPTDSLPHWKAARRLPLLTWPKFRHLVLDPALIASHFKLYDLMVHTRNRPAGFVLRFRKYGQPATLFAVQVLVTRRQDWPRKAG